MRLSTNRNVCGTGRVNVCGLSAGNRARVLAVGSLIVSPNNCADQPSLRNSSIVKYQFLSLLFQLKISIVKYLVAPSVKSIGHIAGRRRDGS